MACLKLLDQLLLCILQRLLLSHWWPSYFTRNWCFLLLNTFLSFSRLTMQSLNLNSLLSLTKDLFRMYFLRRRLYFPGATVQSLSDKILCPFALPLIDLRSQNLPWLSKSTGSMEVARSSAVLAVLEIERCEWSHFAKYGTTINLVHMAIAIHFSPLIATAAPTATFIVLVACEGSKLAVKDLCVRRRALSWVKCDNSTTLNLLRVALATFAKEEPQGLLLFIAASHYCFGFTWRLEPQAFICVAATIINIFAWGGWRRFIQDLRLIWFESEIPRFQSVPEDFIIVSQ